MTNHTTLNSYNRCKKTTPAELAQQISLWLKVILSCQNQFCFEIKIRTLLGEAHEDKL